MSRQTQCCFVFLALTVVCQSSTAGPRLFPVTVNVFNDAAIPDSVLETGKREAGRIFKAAHIEIRWIDCTTTSAVPPDGSCRDPHHLNLRIVPGGKKQNEDVFGAAFLGVDGTGTYSDVFYDSIENLRTQGQTNIGALLGHVMAHEIGHLLIGSHAHSPWGLMCAKWHAEELQRIEMGTLFFTAEQVNSIHSKLAMSRKMADPASDD
jgi:hypothetical protein